MKPSELPGTRTNGTLACLAGTDEQGRLVTAGGFVVPEDYLKIAHGYATTSHSSQGLTANFAVVFGVPEQSAIAERPCAWTRNENPFQRPTRFP